MRPTLLVGASEFWTALRTDIARARSSVLVQTLSFEGDGAGLGLAEAMKRCHAPDRRVLVDEFTRWVHNDRALWKPRNLLDGDLRVEVRATHEMIRELVAGGVGVGWVNPWGPLWMRAAARNHKKLVVVDDRIVYLGGINFSEHNFAWHDMMLRVVDPGVGAFCREDFDRTWVGRPVPSRREFPGLELLSMDGRDNPRLFRPVLGRIAEAREEIVLQTPYLSFPFSDALAGARLRGVRVLLIAPGTNNYGIFDRYTRWEGARCGMDVRLMRGMTHLKAMLVDGDCLIVGSSNFDYFSYRVYEEIVAVVTVPGIIADFRARVLEPDLARCETPEPMPAAGNGLGRLDRLRMRAGGWLLAELAGFRRGRTPRVCHVLRA